MTKDKFYAIKAPTTAFLWTSMDNWVYAVDDVQTPNDFRLLEETGELQWYQDTVDARVLRVLGDQILVNFTLTNPASGNPADGFLLLDASEVDGYSL